MVNKKNIGNLKLDSVRGIATSKEFINTKANMEGVSLENYKVVEPGMIAFKIGRASCRERVC